MIVKGKYKYHYSTINLKASVAKRFRKFSKKVARSHSEALTVIIDFFEWHGFLPDDRFGKKIMDAILKNRKRTNHTIAIIKDIEKNNDKPNTAMLQLLFEGSDGDEEQLEMNQLYDDLKSNEAEPETTAVPKVKYDGIKANMEQAKKKINELLDQIEPVNNRFGKNYLKLDISIQELKKLKRSINKL